jgi:hypothetical protein
MTPEALNEYISKRDKKGLSFAVAERSLCDNWKKNKDSKLRAAQKEMSKKIAIELKKM